MCGRQVRLTSIFNTVIEDVIPGESGGFGHAQFLPATPAYQLPKFSQPSRESRNLLQAISAQEQQRYGPLSKPREQPASAPAAGNQASSLFNASLVADYEQCGGIVNCPYQDQGGPCADKQYFACANLASACVRINAYYWQCRASAAAPQPAAAASPQPQSYVPARASQAVSPSPALVLPIMDDGVFHAQAAATNPPAEPPHAAAVSPAPAPLPALPVTESSVIAEPGCTATSTDPKCMFGRRLLDSTTAAAVQYLQTNPLQPSYIIMQAVHRHLTAVGSGPAPASSLAPSPSIITASISPVPDYGTCGGTGVQYSAAASFTELACFLKHMQQLHHFCAHDDASPCKMSFLGGNVGRKMR